MLPTLSVGQSMPVFFRTSSLTRCLRSSSLKLAVIASPFVSCRTPYATRASVRAPGSLPRRTGATCFVGRGYAPVGKSVQPVRGKAGAGIALEIISLQQFIYQDTAFNPAGIQAYADCRCPHLHVWGGLPQDLLSHVPQHP